MNKHQINDFRLSRARELRSLGRILLDEGFIKDDGPFQIAASECQSSREWGWSYNLEGIRLGESGTYEARMRHTRPNEVKKYVVELSVKLKGIYIDETDLRDPFEELAVNIEVLATADDEADEDDYREWPIACAWHLDRQISDENSNESHFAHPIYHFQYGGQRIWARQEFNYGSHLLMESPRIAHPPLDGILAVDFVLSNYYGDKWRALRGDSDASGRYIDLLQSVQHRVWRPYSFAAASHWSKSSNISFTTPHPWISQLIWPQLG